jgi:hypothetical protein
MNKERAKVALSNIADTFNTGQLSIENRLLAFVTNEYANFYDNIGKPSISPIETTKGEFLKTDIIQLPLGQIDTDLSIGYQQIDRLRLAAKAVVNLCGIERVGLRKLLAGLNSKVDKLQLWISDSDPTYQWVGDSFTTTDSIDLTNSTVTVEASKGIVQLKLDGEEELISKIKSVSVEHPLSKDKVPEGMPGNNLEVLNKDFENANEYKASDEEFNTPITPVLRNASQKDSSNITGMFDSDTSTWFEWEKYVVPVVQKVVARSGYVASDSGKEQAILSINPGDISKSTEAYVADKWYAYAGEQSNFRDNGKNTLTKDYGWKAQIAFPGAAAPEGPYKTVHTCMGTPKNSLTLMFTIEFDMEREITWIELNPFLDSGLPYSLDTVEVRGEDSTVWTNVLTKPIILNKNLNSPIGNETGIPVKSSNGLAIVPCNKKKVKYIRFTLTQAEAYKTKIAHKFYRKKTAATETSMWGHRHDWTEYARVSDDEIDTYESTTGGTGALKTVLGVASMIPGIGMWAGIAASFLGGTGVRRSVVGIDEYYDIFNAYRYSIGIRDLGIYKRLYANTSVFTSKPMYFGKDVKAVSLIVGEFIPETWDTSKKWIRYEVSPDGTNWTEIIPQKNDIEKSVIAIPNTNIIYFRAILSRPVDKPTESPVLSYYAIKGLPADDIN